MEDREFGIQGEPLGFASVEYGEVMDFIHRELQLLDDGELAPWLDLLADEVCYRMPVRVTRPRRGGDAFVATAYYDDTKPPSGGICCGGSTAR